MVVVVVCHVVSYVEFGPSRTRPIDQRIMQHPPSPHSFQATREGYNHDLLSDRPSNFIIPCFEFIKSRLNARPWLQCGI